MGGNAQVGLVKVNERGINRISATFWLLGMLTSIAKNVQELERLMAEVRQRLDSLLLLLLLLLLTLLFSLSLLSASLLLLRLLLLLLLLLMLLLLLLPMLLM